MYTRQAVRCRVLLPVSWFRGRARQAAGAQPLPPFPTRRSTSASCTAASFPPGGHRGKRRAPAGQQEVPPRPSRSASRPFLHGKRLPQPPPPEPLTGQDGTRTAPRSPSNMAAAVVRRAAPPGMPRGAALCQELGGAGRGGCCGRRGARRHRRPRTARCGGCGGGGGSSSSRRRSGERCGAARRGPGRTAGVPSPPSC